MRPGDAWHGGCCLYVVLPVCINVFMLFFASVLSVSMLCMYLC